MRVALIGTTAACVVGFRIELIRALVAQGHEVYALAIDFDEESRKTVEDAGAVSVNYELSRAGLNPLLDAINTYKLSRKLRKINPDLVFSYFAKPVIFGTFAAVLAGVSRRVGMLEGLGYVFTDQPSGLSLKTRIIQKVQVLLYRVALPFLERLIFLNSDDPIDLLEKNRISVKCYSILGPIGLDLSVYPYSAPTVQPVSFIFIGRLLSEKGINQYIAAARMVKEKYPDTVFIVLGGIDADNPGGLSADALAHLVESGLLIHPGHVSDVCEWIAKSSVFVLPSYREGYPRSTQEAMAMGRPVITTNVPGCRETVINGLNGFLVAPWSPEELAEKMIFYIENPHQIEIMGLESYKIAQERFDARKVNEELLRYLIER